MHDDGSIRLDQRFFGYVRGRRTTNRRFHELFGAPARPLGATPTQREAELAASIQVVLEEILMAMALEARRRSDLDALCLAGGVALNCVANGRILRDGPFRDVWVQPAAGDAGNAVGAALWVCAWGIGVYIIGQRLGALAPWVHRLGYLAIGVAALILAAGIVAHARRRRPESRGED